jgi:hypothetical protein
VDPSAIQGRRHASYWADVLMALGTDGGRSSNWFGGMG